MIQRQPTCCALPASFSYHSMIQRQPTCCALPAVYNSSNFRGYAAAFSGCCGSQGLATPLLCKHPAAFTYHSMIQRQPACFALAAVYNSSNFRSYRCFVLGLLRLTRPHPAAFVQAPCCFYVSFHDTTTAYVLRTPGCLQLLELSQLSLLRSRVVAAHKASPGCIRASTLLLLRIIP